MERRKFILTDSHAIATGLAGARRHSPSVDLELLERLALGELPELHLRASLILADALVADSQ
jgi:hypothetical protein